MRSNAAYAFLLDDKARSRVEAQVQVELSGPDAAALWGVSMAPWVSKNVHATLVVAAVLLVVKIVGGTTDSSMRKGLVTDGLVYNGVPVQALILIPLAVFWLGGMVDARRPTASATAKAACRAAGEALAGFVWWFVTALVAYNN